MNVLKIPITGKLHNVFFFSLLSRKRTMRIYTPKFLNSKRGPEPIYISLESNRGSRVQSIIHS